ncbi:MAG TPA: GerMN domain-containing protein [Vicinamibacterales bacterium]|jgi:spore germination protein GerM|nr:GerMN domain-containing protein [Vicinamibacterales bacterium]
MTRRWLTAVVVAVVVVVAGAWALTRGLEFLMRPATEAHAPATEPQQPSTVPHITATLFYTSEDGRYLVPVRREVPLAEGTVEQGKQIMLAQLEPATAPLVSAIPTGTTLRAFYVTDRGEAYVDLSPEASTMHPGGSAAELLTVYAIVNAVTANLPAIMRVQILLDGKEVDTLAGHMDLRRPLQRNESLVQPEG